MWAVQASWDKLPITSKDIQTAIQNDPVLSKVFRYITTGWGSSADNDKLKPFFYRQQELTTEQGCIMWGLRVIIPAVYQHQALQELHKSHPGNVRMKSLARLHVWWPNIDSDIKTLVKECVACNPNRDHP